MFSETDIKCICWKIKDFDDIKMHGATIKKLHWTSLKCSVVSCHREPLFYSNEDVATIQHHAVASCNSAL